LASKSWVTVQALRYYEAMGLVAGKPEPYVFGLARRALHANCQRIAVLGDNLASRHRWCQSRRPSQRPLR
jgi:hypothetical protein